MTTSIFGLVVEQDGVSAGLVSFDDGVIVEFKRIDNAPRYSNYYDLNRYLIFPGFVDIHTHCRDDMSGDDRHKEDYGTVGLAALSGGVVCVADMPNNPIVPLDLASHSAKQDLAKARCPIDVLCYGGIGPEAQPFGNVPYKVFMGPSTRSEDALHFRDNAQLASTLVRYRGKSVSFHCEDPVLLEMYKGQPNHETRRPSICEWTAINVALDFIDEYNLDGKICHVSTQHGLEQIYQRKQAGTKVALEVTPHHLFFDIEMLTTENRRFLQMNPPLRHRQERLAILEAVKNGRFDYLATDHAPHTTNEKLRGISGVPQLDTYGPFVAWLIKEAKVDPLVLWRMACCNPGQWVQNFTGRKIGRIQLGYEASITILDMQKTACDGRPLYTKCNWSPFDLRNLPGMVQTVYLKGQKVVDGLYMSDFKART